MATITVSGIPKFFYHSKPVYVIIILKLVMVGVSAEMQALLSHTVRTNFAIM